jgi:hypothetical protein
MKAFFSQIQIRVRGAGAKSQRGWDLLLSETAAFGCMSCGIVKKKLFSSN